MIRQLAIATSAALFAYILQPAALAQVPERVDWTIAPAGADQADRVQFSVGYRRGRSSSNWSNTTDLAELPGLTAAQLASDNAPVRFQIVREAGRFDCEGIVRRGRGAGECSFTAEPAFTAALARHRIAAPTREQSYGLALARVSIAMVEELERQGYQTPDAGDLVDAGIHRVDPAYIRDMAAAGYRVGTVEGLVGMRIHRVTPDYISALAAAGHRPNAEMAVQMRIHGVRPEFIGELRLLGYERLSAEDLTAMRIHGISADFVRRANGEAGRRLSPEELVSERLMPRRARLGSRS